MATKTYIFRVVADTEEDIFRDIEIGQQQSFLDLHNAILDAYGFRGDQMASFYMSNEMWEKGEEIGLMDMGYEDDTLIRTMSGTTLKSMVKDKNEKILYVYDFLRMWIFYVELVKSSEGSASYPMVIQEFGTSPDEDNKEIPDIMEGIEDEYDYDRQSGPSQQEIDDVFDEFNEDADDDFGGGFERLDDYDF